MSLYKRNGSPYWWASFTVHGHRIQESTGTADRAEAQEYHDTLKARLWRELRLGERRSYTWEEAVIRYLEETQHKRSRKDDILRLRWLDEHLAGRTLEQIDRDHMDRVIARKAHRTPATQNRYLGLVRSILRRAHRDWGWLDNPPNIRMRVEPTHEARWLTRGEFERLRAALPEHLRPPVDFTVATGLRQANVFGLQWRNVDLHRRTAWVHAHKAKANRSIAVPLNSVAMAALRRVEGNHPDHVFTYRGKPMKRFATETWAQALEKADLPGVRFHDLRHTWASWHVMNGTSPRDVMELGSWSDYRMVLRYTHLAADHLADAAERVTKSLQCEKEAEGTTDASC